MISKVLAIVGTVVMDEPFAGVLVVLMQSGGEALERYGFQRATSFLTELLARAPRRAWRKRGNELEEIAVDDVQVGDLLTVRPGELIPVDGTLLTRERRGRQIGPHRRASTARQRSRRQAAERQRQHRGRFRDDADAVASESQYARIVTLVRQAQGDKAPIMRLADQYAVWFTPLTLLMCGLGWFITGDPNTIVAVLVVATPCPLILATPIAVISGINHAARRNIIVKGGTAIEQVGRAQAVVFDKTGTLTFGSPELQHIISANGMSQEDLLHKAASVEQLSSHLLGKTMTQPPRSGWAALCQFPSISRK